MTEKDLAEDYRMVLHEAKSMGCNKIKAFGRAGKSKGHMEQEGE